MLATRRFSGLKAQINSDIPQNGITLNADGSITLTRQAGVCKTVVIPKEYLDEGKVDCTYRPNPDTKEIEVSSGETVLTLADEIGVKEPLQFEITFIDKNTALIELVDGVLYNKNANNVGFGYNTEGKLIRDTSNVKWLSVRYLYEQACNRLMAKYNITQKEVVDYIYNVTTRFSVQYTVYSKSEAATRGCYNSYRQIIPSWTSTISLGEFEFIVFEAEATPVRRTLVANTAGAKSFEDMSYDEQQAYYKRQAEAEEQAEQARAEARLDSYGEDFDEGDFDDLQEEDEYDGYDDFDEFDE